MADPDAVEGTSVDSDSNADQQHANQQPEADIAADFVPAGSDYDDETDSDAASVNTANLFSKLDEPQSPLRKLGVFINRPFGWSGSLYDDYEYVPVNHPNPLMRLN
jgi:hypothetical protein